MAQPEIFSGFSKKTVTFFQGLTVNNNREWFAAQRRDYEEYVLQPAQAFVLAMGKRLRRLTPGITAEPRTDGSLFRIFRDTRFSPDKSPYKTNLGIFFWEGRGPRLECSGYYFHLEPPNLMLGGGLYIFPRPLLERFRRAAADPEYGAELAAIVNKIKCRPGFSIGGQHYQRVPAGYDTGPAGADLLRHSGLYAGVETPIPKEFFTPTLIDYCWERFKPMEPLHRWLTMLVNGRFES
jgi:uncharacterized protein (TIGR02453 family)